MVKRIVNVKYTPAISYVTNSKKEKLLKLTGLELVDEDCSDSNLSSAIFTSWSLLNAALFVIIIAAAIYLSYLAYGNWYGDPLGAVNGAAVTSVFGLANEVRTKPRSLVAAAASVVFTLFAVAGILFLVREHTGFVITKTEDSVVGGWLVALILAAAQPALKRYAYIIRISNCSFDRSDLSSAVMNGTYAERTDFIDAKLSHLQIIGGALELCNLSDADLSSAIFTQANLLASTFTSALAKSTKFTSATISGCRFDQCDLTGASFTLAKISDTYFDKAVLNGVDFHTAKFGNVSFKGAVYDNKTKWPKSFNLAMSGLAGLDPKVISPTPVILEEVPKA